MHWLIIFLEIALNRSIILRNEFVSSPPFPGVSKFEHPLRSRAFPPSNLGKFQKLYFYNTKNLASISISIRGVERELINLKKIPAGRLRNSHLDFGESRWCNRQVPKSGANCGIHGGPRSLLVRHVLILSYVT